MRTCGTLSFTIYKNVQKNTYDNNVIITQITATFTRAILFLLFKQYFSFYSGNTFQFNKSKCMVLKWCNKWEVSFWLVASQRHETRRNKEERGEKVSERDMQENEEATQTEQTRRNRFLHHQLGRSHTSRKESFGLPRDQ